MKRLVSALAAVSAVALAPSAHAGVIISFGATSPVPAINNFQTELAGLGLTRFTTVGATMVLDALSSITFEVLGSESGFSDTFTTVSAPVVTYTENSPFQNNFATPIQIGTGVFGPGNLAGLLNFSSIGGLPATVGEAGFGIFLGGEQQSGANVNTFFLGYDDQITSPDDDNHDDLIIRATVRAVPEPGTWALMLVGFGLLGLALRRSSKPATVRGRISFA